MKVLSFAMIVSVLYTFGGVNPSVDADGPSHAYSGTIYDVKQVYCTDCGADLGLISTGNS